MKKFLILSLFLLLLLWITVSKFVIKIERNEISSIDPNEKILIKNWTIIGPFKNALIQNKDNLESKDLEKFGIDENNISDFDLSSLLIKIKLNPSSELSCINRNFPNENIDLYELFNKPDRKDVSNAYLVSHIFSEKDQEVLLLSSCSYGSEIWVNKNLVAVVHSKRYLDKLYEEYRKIKLKKGKNLVVVKVCCRDINVPVVHWKFSMAISGDQSAKENFRIYYLKDFLEDIFVVNDSINLFLGPYKYDLPVKVRILDKERTILESNEFRKLNAIFCYDKDSSLKYCIKSLKDQNYYYAQLILGNDTLEQPFFKGDYNRQKLNIDLILKNQPATTQLLAAENRFNFLYTYYDKEMTKYKVAEKYPFEERFIGRNRLYSIINMDNTFKYGKGNNSLSGLQFRGFFSEIDNTLQTYILYIPHNIAGAKSIPSIFVIPYESTDSLKMIESWYSMNLNQMETDMKLADKYGYALVYVWMRSGKDRDNPIGFKDVMEVRNDLMKNFSNIDSKKMFLAGTCVGARRAVSILTKYPDIFAAAWLYIPIINNYTPTATSYDAAEPINYLSNLSNNSLYIYTSQDDEVMPMKMVQHYIDSAKKFQVNLKTRILKEVSHYRYPLDQMEEACKLFRNYSMIEKPKYIQFKTNELKYNKSFWIELLQKEKDSISSIKAEAEKNLIKIDLKNVLAFSIDKNKLPYSFSSNTKIMVNNKMVDFSDQGDRLFISLGKIADLHKSPAIEGPIQYIFSSNFIVVKNSNNADLVTLFENQWKKATASDCIIKDESKISSDDIRNSNLIIIGNSYSSKLINEIIDNLPFQVSKEKIQISGKTFAGKNQSCCFIYPNPMHVNKCVLAIEGELNPDLFKKRSMIDLGKDFYIFNKSFDKIASGLFNQKWKLD